MKRGAPKSDPEKVRAFVERGKRSSAESLKSSRSQLTDGTSRSSSVGSKRRKPMKRSQPRRDWADARAKVEREAVCRAASEGCGTTRGCDCEGECAWACWGPLQAAHIVGREHDEPKFNASVHKSIVFYVKPESVVPLCMNHHARYDPHTRGNREQLDLLPYLTGDEKRKALEDLDWDVFAFLHRTTGQRFGPLEDAA